MMIIERNNKTIMNKTVMKYTTIRRQILTGAFKLSTGLILSAALFTSMVGITSCTQVDTSGQSKFKPGHEVDFGRRTEAIDADFYERIYHVSISGSDENGDGSMQSPFASLEKALETGAGADKSAPKAILVSAGTYVCKAVQMQDYIALFGGFDSITWKRDITRYQTVLRGADQSRILLGANHCRLDGFSIMGGRYRGNGGAICCDGTSPEISNNYIFRNITLEPKPWNPKFIHEKAHDGGAVYAENGASPRIRNNLFIGNETENGRGGAVAFNNRCTGVIQNNVFLNNSAGLNDGFRSSDGGAVSIFDWCNTEVRNNLFMGNRALTNNDGGGLFVALWSSARVHGNYFFNNESMDDAGSLFVGGQEHRYDSPLDPLPSAKDFFVSLRGNVIMGGRNPSRNSGAFRFTMESRGEVSNNLIAFNTGVYFQRSDLDIVNNTIIDNVLLVETKEGLNPCRVRNNIILGRMDIETEVEMSHNLILEGGADSLEGNGAETGKSEGDGADAGKSEGNGNQAKDPAMDESHGIEFLKDGLELKIAGVMAGNDRSETRLIVQGIYGKNSLKNRIVRAGTRFTLVKENEGNEIMLWDDLSPEMEFIILPSYTLMDGTAAKDLGITGFSEMEPYDSEN